MVCASLNRLWRTTPPFGPGRAILNGRNHISGGLISGGQVRRLADSRSKSHEVESWNPHLSKIAKGGAASSGVAPPERGEDKPSPPGES